MAIKFAESLNNLKIPVRFLGLIDPIALGTDVTVVRRAPNKANLVPDNNIRLFSQVCG
jgi:hypothetical protein